MRGPIKIPTALGIFLVLALVVGMSLFFERISRQETVASTSIQPKEVQITNVTDTSFAVVWITDTSATGAVAVSSTALTNQTFFDERDTTGKLGKYLTHSVIVRGRKPESDHTIKILSNGKSYSGDGPSYRIRTPTELTTSTNGLEPSYGTVLTADNQPAYGALVFVTVEDSQVFSTIVKPSGSWIVPLNILRIRDLTAFVTPTDRMTETIIVRSDGEEATAITDTLNDSPVPDIVLGKTYDFRKQQAKAPPDLLLAQTQPQAVLGESTDAQSIRTPKVTLIKPAQGDNLPTFYPLVSGSGVPGKVVSITLGIIKPIGGSTVIGSDGMWQFTPPKALAPGKQSVTITTPDAKGKPVAITHAFQILKSGTQVLGEATPSGTLSPTPSLTTTPVATTTPTVLPTPISQSTGSSTLAGQPIPTSGTTFPTLLLIIAGFGLFISGVAAWKYIE